MKMDFLKTNLSLPLGPAPVSEPENSPPKEEQKEKAEIKHLGKLFVGNISFTTTAEHLEEYFSIYGKVVDASVCRQRKTGKSLGYGFVTFADPQTAKIALNVKNHYVNGKTLEIRAYESKKTKNESARLFLGGLPHDISEENIRLFFSRYGEVASVLILRDKITKEPKGCGFLSFKDEAAAEKCEAERFVFLKGRRIQIKKAKDKNKNEDSKSTCTVSEEEVEEDTESDDQSVGSEDFWDAERKQTLYALLEKFNAMNDKKPSACKSEKDVEQLLSDFSTFSIENLLPTGDNLIEFSGEETDSESSDDAVGGQEPGKTVDESESSVLQKSMPLQIRNKEGFYMCSLCQWVAPNDSMDTFLTHCKTSTHRMKLKDRFPPDNQPENPKAVKKDKKKAKNTQKATNDQGDNQQKSKKDSEALKYLKLQALAKGMSSIQPTAGDELMCKMCNKKIPRGMEYDVLMKNVSSHLLSKTHLKKLSEAENLLLDSIKPKQTEKEKPKPGENTPVPKNTAKNSKKKLANKKKQETAQSSGFLCLPCNLMCENTEVFNVHLGLKSHIVSLANKNVKADVSLANMSKCKGCQNYLYGSLYNINKHYSKCIEKKN